MRIYLDACAYNRPFDNQSRDRVRLEAECVSRILGHCDGGEIDLVSSDALEFELGRTPDEVLRNALLELQSKHRDFVRRDRVVVARAATLEEFSIRGMDAIHLALAEKGKVDYFVTTDIDLIKRAQKVESGIKVVDPIDFMLHILEDATDIE